MNIKWKKADFDATMGVFFDGFTKILIAVSALSGVLASDILYGQVMTGIALSVFLLHCYFWYLAEKMKKKENDDSFVALPGGVSAYRFFIYLFSIFFVVLGTHGAETALKVTIMANFIGSLISISGAWLVPILMRLLPGGAVFGALAGASLAFLGINVFSNAITPAPIIGLVSTFVIMIIFLGNIQTKLPAILISILVGIAIGWGGVAFGFTPENILSTETISTSLNSVGFYFPTVDFAFLTAEIWNLTLPFLPLIIAFAIGDVVNIILGVEQAKAEGHNYDEKNVILGISGFSLISSFIGNPFPFTIFFGYNTWKQINAGSAYSLATGAIYLILGLTGAFAIITSIIPIAAVGGILIFIALVSTAQTFETTPKAHFAAVSMALMLPIIEVIVTMMGQKAADIVPQLIPLAQGSTITAIVWASALIYIIENKWIKAGCTLLVAALLSLIGLIHSAQVSFFSNPEYTLSYTILALGLIVYGKTTTVNN